MGGEWVKNATREATVFPAVGVTRSISMTRKVFAIAFDYTHFLFVDNTWFYPAEKYKTICKIFEKKIKKDPRYILKIQANQKKNGESLKAYIKKINKKKYSKKELAIEILRYDQKMTEFYAFWWIAIPSGDILEKNVKDVLEKNNNLVNFNDLMFVRHELELMREKRLLANISLESKKYKTFSNLPQKLKAKYSRHAKQFSWINSSYHLGHTVTAKNFFEKTKMEDPRDILEETKEQRRKEKKILHTISKSLKKKDQLMIEAMHAIMYLRNYQKETVNECQNKSEFFLDLAAKALFVKLEMLVYLSPQEVATYLGKKNLDFSEIENICNKRKKVYAVEYINKKTTVKDDKNDIKKYQIMIESGVEKKVIGDLKGSPACNGNVKGRVRIVLNKKDIAEFVDGEVLVTIMTSIDYVYIMKRASAIVTDEGGITCHAAIFSREFNVPCVIGTKAATKTLKNGDMVEVDANTGVIKII